MAMSMWTRLILDEYDKPLLDALDTPQEAVNHQFIIFIPILLIL